MNAETLDRWRQYASSALAGLTAGARTPEQLTVDKARMENMCREAAFMADEMMEHEAERKRHTSRWRPE